MESDQSKPRKRRGRQAPPLEGAWLSVDPGERHVGVGVWVGEELIEAFETTPDGFREAIKARRPKLVVIEAFSLRSPRWTNAQAVQALETVKLIGGVQALMEQWEGVVVEQQPAVRHVAQASPFWTDMPDVPANSHVRSAVAHGVYYVHFAKR